MINTPVYAIATDIISPIGFGVQAHWDAVLQGRVGVQEHQDASVGATTFWGARLSDEQLAEVNKQTEEELTIFEKLVVSSVRRATSGIQGILTSDDTLLVLSTTKGNIELLDSQPDKRTLLSTSAQVISQALGLKNRSIVVSQACISGALAQLYALRQMQNGRYKHAVIVGCDRFSRFVLNGFQSFQAIADGPCRPFDADRKGINLGEAAATVVLSTEKVNQPKAVLLSGATSNDANHISGPSRTGAELSMAIDRTLKEAGAEAKDVDMISAHGTATPYNDEMESKAFGLSQVAHASTHSFKGYTGHTLGAAGVLECAMLIKGIAEQTLIPSAGYEQLGVPVDLNICTEAKPHTINHVLKTASGFGGCNAALLWARVDD